MTLLAYEIFATAARCLSFQQTAEKLNLTPSAISHSINNFENEVGFPLFYRHKNRISLTSHGEMLLPYIDKILKADLGLHQVISEHKGFQKGLVRLGCFNSICMTLIPSLTKGFHELYPGIEIEIFQGSYADISAWLMEGTIDIGFLSVSSANDLPITPLYNDQLMCVVPKNFKTICKDYITIPELADQNFVLPMENCDADSQILLQEYGLNTKSNCHVIDDLSTLTMVEAGFGVCILPELVIKGFHFNVDIYPIKPAVYRVIGISYLPSSLMLPAVKKLYQFILDTYQQTSF